MRILLLFLLTLLGLTVQAHAQDDSIVADVSDRRIAVTAGFSGATTTLFGALPDEGDVIIVVTGPTQDITVRRKERVLGLWLNQSSVAFRAVPGFYWVGSSRPLAEIASTDFLTAKRIGLEHLRFTIATASNLAEITFFQQALMDLRTEASDFTRLPSLVTIMGGRLYRADLHLPASAPMGDYAITTYLLQKGKVVSVEQTPLTLRKEGTMAAVSAVAAQKPILYAIVAILLALFSGWMSALLMQRR